MKVWLHRWLGMQPFFCLFHWWLCLVCQICTNSKTKLTSEYDIKASLTFAKLLFDLPTSKFITVTLFTIFVKALSIQEVFLGFRKTAYPTAVVGYTNWIVIMKDYINLSSIACLSFIHSIIQYFNNLEYTKQNDDQARNEVEHLITWKKGKLNQLRLPDDATHVVLCCQCTYQAFCELRPMPLRPAS